jgi:hypothetical protein
MGWNSNRFARAKSVGRLALAALCLALVGRGARAQAVVNNAYLQLSVGSVGIPSGSIRLSTTAGNTNDPGNFIIQSGTILPTAGGTTGSWLYVRVDGGNSAFNSNVRGYDFIFGDLTTGFWLTPPTVVGTHIEAKFQAFPLAIKPSGNGNILFLDPGIEVDMTATLVHDSVRFQFTIVNPSQGAAHTVGLCFVQDIVVQPTSINLAILPPPKDGPLRLPGQPDLRHETMLAGGAVPPFWESFVQSAPAKGTAPAKIHSIRGTLKPLNQNANDPTPPSRMAYGLAASLNAAIVLNTFRNFDAIWSFQPNPSVDLTLNDAAVAIYFDEEQVGATETLTKVTYLGAASSDNDFGSPMSLSVSGPNALGLSVDRTNASSPKLVVGPSPFTITAYVQNLTDLSQSGGTNIGPVSLFLTLPRGLKFHTDPTTGIDTASKTIASVTPGGEGSVSWSVEPDLTPLVNPATGFPDPTAHVTGSLRYTITASPNLGNGKSIQRTIEVPAPPIITLKSRDTIGGIFVMKSFPLITGNDSPTDVLGLRPLFPLGSGPGTPPVEVVRYDPVAGHYAPVNTFQPGFAYWLRSIVDVANPIDVIKYPPLGNQVQPGADSFKVNYPRGWNQVGDPYVYNFRFSEIQVFDSDSLQLLNIVDAADPVHKWILPAAYRFDTSDPDPTNWHYELLDNLGFLMQPGDGYWILVLKTNLQFIFPGVDTPGGSVTRAALLGVGIGTNPGRNTVNNWRLNLVARGSNSSDRLAAIGVAPKATDGPDVYKLNKPPSLNNQVTLDILHDDWKDSNGRYAQDLRSPGQSRKVWDMMVTSAKPNEDVTLTWPAIAASVPRNYQLTLIDRDTNVRRNLRQTASYTVNTGASKTRSIQIIAEPAGRGGNTLITSFHVVSNQTRGAAAPTSVAIHYGLSSATDARIFIRDGSGRTIRTLVGVTRAASGGSGLTEGEAVWDMKDQRGVALPSGLYQVELLATNGDGHRSRQIQPFLLTR